MRSRFWIGFFARFALSAILVAGTGVARAAEPATAPFDYWRQLDDSTLSRLQQQVLKSNLDVQAARARLSAARSDRTRSLLDLTPSTRVVGAFSRQRFSSAAFPGASGQFPEQDVWESGIDASWELDVFGRVRSNVRARGALADAAEEDVRYVQVAMSAELARAYFELRGAQEQLEVARRNAENQRRTFEVTKERLDAGRGTALDTERAQAQWSSTLASIPTREAQVEAQRNRIGVLIGSSGRPLAELAGMLDRPAPLPRLPEVTSIGDREHVIRNRPDVAAAEQRADALSALTGAARAAYLPRITLGGALGYSANEFDALGGSSRTRFAIGPVITWPGLDLGRVKAEADAARAREQAAQLEYAQATLAAAQEIESALAFYRSARVRVERLEESRAASERAAELARLRFREGRIDFLQVLDAERTQLEAQERAVEGHTQAASAYAALFRAVAGR